LCQFKCLEGQVKHCDGRLGSGLELAYGSHWRHAKQISSPIYGCRFGIM